MGRGCDRGKAECKCEQSCRESWFQVESPRKIRWPDHRHDSTRQNRQWGSRRAMAVDSRGVRLGLLVRHGKRLHRAAIRAFVDRRRRARPFCRLAVRSNLHRSGKVHFARGVLVVGPRGLQGYLAAHPSGTCHVGSHALGLLDEVGHATTTYLRKYGAVFVEILLRDTKPSCVRASTSWIRYARRERRLLPSRGRGQLPQAGRSGLCRGKRRHGEKATDQSDPTLSPSHDPSCCVA